MRNLKKFLALVLATMMLLSVAVISTSAASTDADYTEAAQRLAALQVMKGNENGDLMLENGVTRYQAALFFVQALTGETETATWNSTKNSAYFSDVVDYGTAIDYAYGIGLILGRGNGVYGYNDAILYQDMLVMAVRALGYETDDMAYPYGYILAAQKLGLTENVALVDYKAALTRGETAQIIWDMLDTEVAATDPITDKILYPGEVGLTDALLGKDGEVIVERETLMESSDLAGDKITAYVYDFVEADEDDEDAFDTVDLYSVDLDEVVTIAAADLGITVDTPVVSYAGLAYELYIDVDADDFDQAAYDDGDAAIVFAYQPTYTDVLNLGDGNVKFVVNSTDESKSYFSFGGTKFAVNKYMFAVAAFNAEDECWDWTYETDYEDDDGDNLILDEWLLAEMFLYEDDEYVASANQYANISYNVTDITVKDEDDNEYTVVEVLYTPLSFGQYNVREVNDTEYTVIGTYDESATTYKNLDDESSLFVEYLVDGAAKVSSSTKSISNSKGEAAKTVTLAGAAVEAGDFMFYAYNSVDNILTVAKNCGTFETGRLTSVTTKETVKIDGSYYGFGFAGTAETNGMPSAWEDYEDLVDGYIANLEAGKDNVKYILVDGNIVYMEECSETSNNSYFDFAIITTDAEIMADLLDMTDAKYANALTAGVYVDDNGYMAVAMMNLETGKWELASIKAVEYGWNAEDEEFDNTADPATLASYVEMFETASDYKNYDKYEKALEVVAEGLVCVVDENDGVYTIASNETLDLEAADGADYGFFTAGTTNVGITFSDNSVKTNAITADDDVDAERVSLDADSVIVVVTENGEAGARVGVQSADDSYKVVSGYFLAASSDLIVLVETDAVDGVIDIADWADAKSANSDENWFVTTVDTGVEVEVDEDDEDMRIVTITNVYDMKAKEVIDSVQVTVESDDVSDYTALKTSGVVLFKNAKDEITVEGEFADVIADIIEDVANDNDDKLDYTYVDLAADESGSVEFKFDSADTVYLTGIVDGEAVTVDATVVTLDFTDLDTAKYDFSEVISSKTWEDGDENNEYKVADVKVTYDGAKADYWEYLLDTELVSVIDEPTEDVLNNYIIDEANNGQTILVPLADDSDYANAAEVNVTLYVAAAYDAEDSDVLTLVVYKVLTLVD